MTYRPQAAVWIGATATASAILAALVVHAPMLAVGLCLGLGVLFVALLHPRASHAVLLTLIALPLFYDSGSRSLTLTRLFREGTTGETATRIHIGAILLAVFAVAFVIRIPLRLRPEPLPGRFLILAMIGCFTLSIAFGLGQGSGQLGVVFYLQTILPLVAWLVFAYADIDLGTAARIVMIATTIAVWCALLYAVRTGSLLDPYDASRNTETIIPQYLSYFPAIQMCGAAFAITYFRQFRLLSVITLASLACSLPLLWSRGGAAMIALALLVAFITRPGKSSLGTRGVIAAIAGSGVMVLAWRLLSHGTLGARQADAAVLQSSDSTRVDLAKTAVSRIAESPLVGDQFHPYSSTLVGGRVADFARLFPAHNQYLDYALRGGVIAAALLVVFLVRQVLTARKIAYDLQEAPSARAYHAGITAIVTALLVGNLGELYLTQAWTGSLIFSLLGASAAYQYRVLGQRREADLQTGSPLIAGPRPRRGSATPSRR